MNTAPDELTLMAYADGQLDAAARRDVEAALAASPALAARVQQHQALARRVAAAFGPALEEPVPARLQQLLQTTTPAPEAAPVVDLAAARAARSTPPAPATRAQDGWAHWGGMAACLVLGVALGLGSQRPGAGAPDGFVASGPRLLASGAVAQALQTQPAGAAGATGASSAAGAVVVSLSFIDREGRYCRAFSTAGQGGLACRDGQAWAVAALAALGAQPSAPAGAMRQAGTALPAAVLQAVDERIAGSALDATAEASALKRGWSR